MKLSARYGLQQFIYFAASASFYCYAVTFLLDRGIPAAQTGVLLGAGNILSCVLQPLLGAMVDRAKKPILIPTLLVLTVLTMLGFGTVVALRLPVPVFAALYLLANLFFNSMMSLMNSITITYRSEQEEISFSMGRGMGSLSFGIFSLLMGYVIVWVGIDWIMWFAIGVMAVFFLVTLGFLRYTPAKASVQKQERQEDSLSLPAFFVKYRLFVLSMVGVMCLGMFHSMTENYLISIVGRLGGDSSHQGIALCIATVGSVPMFFLIDRIRKHVSVRGLLILSGLFFILKSVMLLVAPSIPVIYAAQLLQMVTYAFLAPAQVYYADMSVEAADKVKGQTVSGACYTLGCAMGSIAGGILLEQVGVTGMLVAGVGMTVVGTVILLLTVKRRI